MKPHLNEHEFMIDSGQTQRRFRMSIGGLMSVIALIALEMALFGRLVPLVLLPPATMAIVSLNLVVLFPSGFLPPRVANRIGGLLCGGLISIFVLVGYYVLGGFDESMHGWGAKALGLFLSDQAASRPDPSDGAADALRFGARWSVVVEIILLDLVGLAIIWAGGWIDYWSASGRDRRGLGQARQAAPRGDPGSSGD
jgi:hypothetical protein